MRTTLDYSETRGFSGDVFAAIETATIAHLRATMTGAPAPVLLLSGPPGTGKTMLARRLPTILPALTDHARAWLTAEYEGVGMEVGSGADITARPFRAPHHTISAAALVGEPARVHPANAPACPMCAQTAKRGQAIDPYHQFHTLPRAVVPRVGELGLARFGVLFLDELPEFRLEALRALGSALRAMAPGTRPMIVASANACPCGWGDGTHDASGYAARKCTCSASAVERYRARVAASVAALGTNTIAIDVPTVALADMRDGKPGPASETIRSLVAARIGGAS